MTLPQLNIPNYGNAVSNLINVDQAKLKKNNLVKEGENWDYKNSPGVRANENKLAKLTTEAKELDNKIKKQDSSIKMYSHFEEGVSKTLANVLTGNPNAHTLMKEHMETDMGFPSGVIPDIEVFYTDKPTIDASGKTTTTKTFDTEMYTKWANATRQTASEGAKASAENKKLTGKMETVYHADKAPMKVYVEKGKTFNTEEKVGKGWSFEKEEKPEKKNFKKVYKDGKVVWEDESKIGGMETEENKSSTVSEDKKATAAIKAEEATLKADEELVKGRTFTNSKGKKGEYNLLSDKTEGKKYADKYNRNAERAGLDERYVWKEDITEIPGDWLAKLLPGGSDGEPTVEGGWVKVDKSEMKGEVNSSKESEKVDFVMDEPLLEEYRKKYPGRSDEEIKAAFKKTVAK